MLSQPKLLPFTIRRAISVDFAVAVTIVAVHIAIGIGVAVEVTEIAVSVVWVRVATMYEISQTKNFSPK